MKPILLSITLFLGALPAFAQAPTDVTRLLDAMRMNEMLGVMRDEGVAYAQGLEAEMFPGRGGALWDQMVGKIYDQERMQTVVARVFAEELSQSDLAPLIAFFGSETGLQVIDLEITARRAIMDEAVEEASHEKVLAMRDAADPRVDLLDDFIETNDLIESNVVGALNSNFAFYLGLAGSGAFPIEMSEDDMLADVWSQEPDIRAETVDWLYAYLALAYGPLEDTQVQGYIDVAASDAGQELNVALFEAFDVLYRQISRELGLAAGQLVVGEDI